MSHFTLGSGSPCSSKPDYSDVDGKEIESGEKSLAEIAGPE
ncbi:MAG: hypothetical protein ACRCYW_00485 [Aeromonas sp.]